VEQVVEDGDAGDTINGNHMPIEEHQCDAGGTTAGTSPASHPAAHILSTLRGSSSADSLIVQAFQYSTVRTTTCCVQPSTVPPVVFKSVT
jgi:hypothetical protein